MSCMQADREKILIHFKEESDQNHTFLNINYFHVV